MMSPYKHRKIKWSESFTDTDDSIILCIKRPRYDTSAVEAMTEANCFSCAATEDEKTEDDTSYYAGVNSPINKNPDSRGEELERDTSKPRYHTPETEDIIQANLSLCSEDEPFSLLSEAELDTTECSDIYARKSDNPDAPRDRLTESDTSQTNVLVNHDCASEVNGSSKWQSSPTGLRWGPNVDPSVHQQTNDEKLNLRSERLKRNVLVLIGGDLHFHHKAGCATWQHKLTRYFKNLVAKQNGERLTSTGSDEEPYISTEEDREDSEKLQHHYTDVEDFDANGFSTGHDLHQLAESHSDRPASYGHYEKPYIEIKNSSEDEPFCLGLPNLEQTCYMNATLQALLSLTPFVQEVCKQRKVWSYCPTSEVMRWFVKVKYCRFSNNNKTKAYVLAAFKMIVAEFNPEFQDSFQKDAHEFLTCVLDMMKIQSVKLQKSARCMGLSYTCPVNAHIAFQMMSTRTCTGCGVQSFKNEDYINLALDLVPGGSLSDCLEEYLKESDLEYKCECGAERSTLCSSFLNLPNVLIVQLKRFTFTHCGTGIKLDKPVHVLQDLEVNPGNFQKTHYCLISIISHLGKTPDSGHYVCDVARRDTSGALTEDWLIFSDMQVWETTGALICQWRERNAYLLFYEKTP